ncbi:MAG: class I SAM-dependent methyltransferase [Candidatus Brocadiaceae bacterium]|nr:class I SAM-dependent methyltransferase [Candidatus Brocadiaceae bacterium]
MGSNILNMALILFSEFEGDKINEQLFWDRGKEVAEGFLAHLKLGNTSSQEMVELGCGLGRMTHSFAKFFDKVHAFDISSKMLERAKAKWKHLSNIEFV